jgi:hypothetical protein
MFIHCTNKKPWELNTVCYSLPTTRVLHVTWPRLLQIQTIHSKVSLYRAYRPGLQFCRRTGAHESSARFVGIPSSGNLTFQFCKRASNLQKPLIQQPWEVMWAAILLSTIAAALCIALCAKETASKDILGAFSKRTAELHRVSKNHRSFLRIYDQYTYIEHNDSVVLKDFGLKKLSKLRFLHIPKTGTTLAATFAHYCCDLDGVFVDVVRQFLSLVPGPVLPKVCNMECFQCQPRSPNGDPWAHIPYRQGVDSHQMTIAVFRQPESRLASQLAYMQVIGPKLSMSFGFRRLDSHILYHLLSYNYDASLSHYLNILQTGIDKSTAPSALRDSAYGLTPQNASIRLLNYNSPTFMKLAESCVQLQSKLKVPPLAPVALYNLSNSADILHDRLRNHFGSNSAAMEDFMYCGMRAAVHYPGLQGCQTRMVLGRSCVDSYTLTERDVAEAKRRLEEEFAFVGKELVCACVRCPAECRDMAPV